ncbi:MAG: hypothetical protein A3E87_02370 [Gammaproteobacteria bacterium RIFCSPHIGHO2_12_FULL_35_23]|nr:MAG: hypothetical protein A3E87_02370 [Gammaproteobacteria bacterium RIFCSPHIGHO2_12_FULL_35_23]
MNSKQPISQPVNILANNHWATPASSYKPHNSYHLPLHPNSLTGIAGKLFSILCELKNPNKKYDLNKLRPYLLNELQQFAEQSKAQGHNEETILLGQYILSKCFDTVIAETSWGGNWQLNNLAATLPHAQSLDDNFAGALKKMAQMPEIFIDILELIYLCINLSETKHRPKNSTQSLTEINKELFYIIQNQRGEFEKSLSKRSAWKKNQPFFNFRKTTFWAFTGGALLMIVALYISFNYLTLQSSKPLTRLLQTLNHKPNQS